MGLASEQTALLDNMAPSLHSPPVKSYDAGIVDGNGYGAFSGFAAKEAPASIDWQEKVPSERRKRVIIVGAGICGIQQASVLLRDGDIKIEDMVIFDALGDFGGVWEKNKYPGCACDVPAMVYTTSYHINTEYSHYFAERQEIQSYYAQFAKSYNLQACTRFESLVKSCSWDEDLMVWHVGVEDKQSGTMQHWVSDTVIQCIGSLDRPKWGNTPGRENYKGVSWHTAHWRHDYDLTGKNVAIIGCGPSAAQIIPQIVDKVSHLTVYMRTPPVCVPRNDYKHSKLFRWAMRYIPLFPFLIRLRLNLEMMIWGKQTATEGAKLNTNLTLAANHFMESQIQDPVLREKLRPNSKFFCKRPLFLDTFYSALAKPNCTVLKEKLIRYTPNGVISEEQGVSQEQERAFDVIIFGTGFNVSQFLEHEKITGIGGVDLQVKWKEHPEALYGLATNGFPNMFMCFGPNSAHVWSSQQDTWERQARFNCKMIREIHQSERKGLKLAVHPNRQVERDYNLTLQQEQIGKFVWMNPTCITYYKNDAGWNTYTMPWSWWQFRNMLRKIQWNQWERVEKPLGKEDSFPEI
ncbi:hypothetical protein BFJ70_g16122 [Fusarium oxysporum]|nr:hypothetical protein BFJ70_g16122 [Fusarium oxysporum]